MSAEKKKEIASKGGKAAHAMGPPISGRAKRLRQPGEKVTLISRRRPKKATQE